MPASWADTILLFAFGSWDREAEGRRARWWEVRRHPHPSIWQRVPSMASVSAAPRSTCGLMARY